MGGMSQIEVRVSAADPAVLKRASDMVLAKMKAVSATIQRRPADVLAFFRGCLKRTIAVIPVTPRRGVLPLVRDDDDPFAPY